MKQVSDRAAVLRDRKCVARKLEKKIPAIIEAWTSRLQAQLDAALGYKKSVLVDSMPKVLKNLCRSLSRGGWNYPDTEGTDVAYTHGKQREALQDYDLAQVIDEYALLRVVMTPVIIDKATLDPTREFIHQYIDANIRGACAAFAARAHARATKDLVQERNVAVRGRSRAKRALVQVKAERDHIAEHIKRLNTDRAARSRMIAILGHDMRAPLTAVLMQAQRIENAGKGVASDKIERVANRIIHGVSRINDMIGSLIDADRTETAGEPTLRVEPGNLADIVKRAIRTVAGQKRKRFVTHFEGDGNGYWDVSAVQRAVENLCSNALKYGSKDGPITVATTSDGLFVRISVHNQGSYLSPSERRGLFEAYSRRQQDEQDLTGWGLGLAQVKQTAATHGGRVTVHSRAKKGTAFCLHMLRNTRGLCGGEL